MKNTLDNITATLDQIYLNGKNSITPWSLGFLSSFLPFIAVPLITTGCSTNSATEEEFFDRSEKQVIADRPTEAHTRTTIKTYEATIDTVAATPIIFGRHGSADRFELAVNGIDKNASDYRIPKTGKRVSDYVNEGFIGLVISQEDTSPSFQRINYLISRLNQSLNLIDIKPGDVEKAHYLVNLFSELNRNKSISLEEFKVISSNDGVVDGIRDVVTSEELGKTIDGYPAKSINPRAKVRVNKDHILWHIGEVLIIPESYLRKEFRLAPRLKAYSNYVDRDADGRVFQGGQGGPGTVDGGTRHQDTTTVFLNGELTPVTLPVTKDYIPRLDGVEDSPYSDFTDTSTANNALGIYFGLGFMANRGHVNPINTEFNAGVSNLFGLVDAGFNFGLSGGTVADSFWPGPTGMTVQSFDNLDYFGLEAAARVTPFLKLGYGVQHNSVRNTVRQEVWDDVGHFKPVNTRFPNESYVTHGPNVTYDINDKLSVSAKARFGSEKKLSAGATLNYNIPLRK